MEMDLCAEFKITHSKFLSWSAEDRGKALAHLIEKNSKCPQCGTAEWEWAEDRRAYYPMEKICSGCELKEIVAEDSESHPGKFVVLVPRER